MSVTRQQANAAAQVMEHFAEHDASHGYAQDARYGDGRGYCDVPTDLGTLKVRTGDADCTSGVVAALEAAKVGTGGASWTGNYYDCLVGSGNFRAHRTSDGSNCDDGYVAQRGDVYLAHNGYWQHAAMCTSAEPDMLAEFSINSQGGVSGDPVGDQTGRECLVREFYGGHWDYVMELVVDGESAPQQTPSASAGDVPTDVKYRVYRGGKWRGWKRGGAVAGVAGTAIYDFQAMGLGANGWFQLTLEGGEVLPRNQTNDAHRKRVIGVTVYYDTPEPWSTGYYEAVYQVHTVAGAWLKVEYDDDDGGAGDDCNAIDQVKLTLGRCDNRVTQI